MNTTAQVGGALGLAVLATLSTSHSNSLKASGVPTASALTSGYHLAFWVASALVGCALVVVLAAIGREGAPAGSPDAVVRDGDQQRIGDRLAAERR